MSGNGGLHIGRDETAWAPVPAGSDFPIQNLPFGFVRTSDGRTHLAVRLGDFILPMRAGEDRRIPNRETIREIRQEAFERLRSGATHQAATQAELIPIAHVESVLPAIPAFVDFYSGINHASNVGRMFRPDMPALLPNYRHLPVAYNGRASTVFPSQTPIHRPDGIQKVGEDVIFGPTRELDFELEMGFFLAEGNQGAALAPAQAEDRMAGIALVNDWSARDVQRFEYQPLGPFLAKSFATSVSGWIVTLDALEPFRCEGPTQTPEPLPHLRPNRPGHFNIHLEALIRTPAMTKPQLITRTNARELYWSFAQQLAHQSSNGTFVEPGELYASGTISGEVPGSFGSLLESTWRGTEPLTMAETGETRTFLQDGDEITFRGWCEDDGVRIGFGELTNRVTRAD